MATWGVRKKITDLVYRCNASVERPAEFEAAFQTIARRFEDIAFGSWHRGRNRIHEPLRGGRPAVVPGFYGALPDGAIKTFFAYTKPDF